MGKVSGDIIPIRWSKIFISNYFLLQKVSVARWLHKLMDGGQEAVDTILRKPESAKQRYLAEQYQEVLSKHREW